MDFIKSVINVSTEIVVECNLAIGRAERYAWNETRKTVQNISEKVQNKNDSKIQDPKKKPLLSEEYAVSI